MKQIIGYNKSAKIGEIRVETTDTNRELLGANYVEWKVKEP